MFKQGNKVAMGDFVSYGMTNEKLNKGEKIMSQNKKRVNNPSS